MKPSFDENNFDRVLILIFLVGLNGSGVSSQAGPHTRYNYKIMGIYSDPFLLQFFFLSPGQCTSSPEDADGRNIQALQLAAAQGSHK
jgi:hypothetical protein